MNDRFKFRVWFNSIKRYSRNTDNLCLGEDGSLGSFDSYGCYSEDAYTIEQCTGLKDKNGKLIYEGDIVKQFNNHGRLLRVGYIIYDENEMKFKVREERCPDWNEKTDDFTFHPLKQKLLVIGNIHEKKEEQ